TNPACHGLTIGREAMLERRRDVMRAMSVLAAGQRSTILWDPLPIFCPARTCEAVPGGRPLFFDGDHPSGLGNDLIYADLKRTILGVR
ncbi:MAG: acyltransferase, partial [Proteobacteria bacterium]|nr:acyltransferase [Pseudomonadota bacterium]